MIVEYVEVACPLDSRYYLTEPIIYSASTSLTQGDYMNMGEGGNYDSSFHNNYEFQGESRIDLQPVVTSTKAVSQYCIF